MFLDLYQLYNHFDENIDILTTIKQNLNRILSF